MKWTKDGAGWGAELRRWHALHVDKDRVWDGPSGWVWFVVDNKGRHHIAEGFASTRAKARECAEAVAEVLGLMP